MNRKQPLRRYIAFLRAINVGGHTVKMDVLRAHFTRLGLANVETFIASGNVIFDAAADPRRLESRARASARRPYPARFSSGRLDAR